MADKKTDLMKQQEKEQDTIMREMIKKEMIGRIQQKIDDEDSDVITAIKRLVAEDDQIKSKL